LTYGEGVKEADKKLSVSLKDLALMASISQVILAAVIGVITVLILRQQARIAQQQWVLSVLCVFNQFGQRVCFDGRNQLADRASEGDHSLSHKRRGDFIYEQLSLDIECVNRT
jgi:hypothetical protein